MWWRQLAEVQTEYQNGEERGFKWLWTWNGCWCQTGWSEYFKNADLLGFLRTTISSVYREWLEKEKISSEQQLCGQKCLVDVRGQRRMGRLVRDRKTTVTQITTRYNQGMQNIISERTTHRNLNKMDYSSRRPHRVPLLSAKSRKRRLQTQAHQNWTIENWKNVAWSDESRFLMRHSDGRVRIWRKGHASILPCLNGSGWCNGVGDIFLAYFGPLSTNRALFKRHATVLLLTMSHPFMTTV